MSAPERACLSGPLGCALRSVSQVSVLRDIPRGGKSAGKIVSLRGLRRTLGTLTPIGGAAGWANEGAAAGADVLARGGELDVCALFCLMGNDYLPKMREASFDRLWGAFTTLRAHDDMRDRRLLNPAARSLDEIFLTALLRVVAAVARLSKAHATRLLQEGASPSEARSASALTGLDAATLLALVNDAVAVGQADRAGEDDEDDEDDEDGASAGRGTAGAAVAGSKGSWRGVQKGGLAYDAGGYLGGILWVVQMYADGVCPDCALAQESNSSAHAATPHCVPPARPPARPPACRPCHAATLPVGRPKHTPVPGPPPPQIHGNTMPTSRRAAVG